MGLILAIDDETATLKLIEMQLSSKGYRVITANTGKKGLEYARSSIPDLILLDIIMPEITGFDIIKELNKDEDTKNIPVIMLTVLNDKDTVLRTMQGGAVDYIVKPHDLDILVTKINTALYYGNLRKQKEEDGQLEYIKITRSKDIINISFKIDISHKKFIREAKTVFNSFFLKQIKNRLPVFDVRILANFDDNDVTTLETIIKLFKDKEVFIVAGRHYGTIVANSTIIDDDKLFISHGDMELYLNKEKGIDIV